MSEKKFKELKYDCESDKDCKSNENFFDSVNYVYSLIDLPVFTPNKKVVEGISVQYAFSAKDQNGFSVSPMYDSKIPQEFDEKIFSAILRIAEYQNSDLVITDYYTLAKAAGVSYNHLKRIKDSIERFKCGLTRYYSKGGFWCFNLLPLTFTMTFEKPGDAAKFDIENTENHLFNKKTEERISNYLKSKQNLKYLLVLQIDPDFFSDIQNGRFLTFDKKLIFSLTFTARRLFLLLKQQQIVENKHKFYCAFLASRIPLSWKSSRVVGTLDSIEKAAEMLKTKGLIKDYCLTRKKPLKNSYIDFVFTDAECAKNENQV